MAEYIIRSNSIDDADFYAHLEGIEKLAISDRYQLQDRPAATIAFPGTVKALYEALGYTSEDAMISHLRHYAIPRTPRPRVKRI